MAKVIIGINTNDIKALEALNNVENIIAPISIHKSKLDYFNGREWVRQFDRFDKTKLSTYICEMTNPKIKALKKHCEINRIHGGVRLLVL